MFFGVTEREVGKKGEKKGRGLRGNFHLEFLSESHSLFPVSDYVSEKIMKAAIYGSKFHPSTYMELWIYGWVEYFEITSGYAAKPLGALKVRGRGESTFVILNFFSKRKSFKNNTSILIYLNLMTCQTDL